MGSKASKAVPRQFPKSVPLNNNNFAKSNTFTNPPPEVQNPTPPPDHPQTQNQTQIPSENETNLNTQTSENKDQFDQGSLNQEETKMREFLHRLTFMTDAIQQDENHFELVAPEGVKFVRNYHTEKAHIEKIQQEEIQEIKKRRVGKLDRDQVDQFFEFIHKDPVLWNSEKLSKHFNFKKETIDSVLEYYSPLEYQEAQNPKKELPTKKEPPVAQKE